MNKILAFVFSLLFLFFLNKYLSLFSFPNTYLTRISVANKTQNNIDQILQNQFNKSAFIEIKGRVYQYSYRQLGILLDRNKTLEAIFEPNKKPFPQNLIAFTKSFSSKRTLLPVFIFTQDFYQFVQNSSYDFSSIPDEITLDSTKKLFVYKENEEKYIIEAENLKTQIVFHFGETNEPLKPNIVKIQNPEKEKIEAYNHQLTEVFTKPVHVIVQDGETSSSFDFLPDDIKKILTVTYLSDIEELHIDIDEQVFEKIFFRYTSRFVKNSDKKIPLVTLKKDLVSLIHLRSTGINVDTILTRVEEAPNSNGTIAQKYIEIDISQQKLYTFLNGTINKSYKISTGLYYPTPIGSFKIINKADNAYSDIYHVYMPYWMGFGYSKELNAYFGIHELPYWLTDEGYKIQRPREFIGSPHTGGCVALDIGDALEVYNFTEIGIPVVIYN